MAIKQKTLSGKEVLVSVLSFVMSLALVLLTTVSVLHVTLFNDRGLFNKVSKTTYFSELNNEIVIRCKTITVKSGVDYKAVESVLTSNRVDADFTVYFNSMSGKNPYAGRDALKTGELAVELYNSIVEYDIDITEEEKENARRISVLLANEYKKVFVLENFEKFIGFSESFKIYSVYVFFILLALVVYLCFTLSYLSSRRQRHRLIRRFAVVFGSTGVTVLCLSLIMKLTGAFEQINFAASQREYNLFMSFFNDFLNWSILVGAGRLLVCICVVIYWYMAVTGRTRK